MTTCSESYLNNPRPELKEFLPPGAKRLLDVGCAGGAFGATLKAEREIEVWGVEPNVDVASTAGALLDKVISAPFTEDVQLPDGYFDAIFFNDSLEHMVDPWAALRVAKKKLAVNGCIIVSLPNLLHVENLLHIVKDRDFRYESNGVRDRTHLRFFTKTSACRMLEECGYSVRQVEGINKDWWTPSLVRRTAFRVFGRLLEETKYMQFVYIARPA